jgi:hypothetical protein
MMNDEYKASLSFILAFILPILSILLIPLWTSLALLLTFLKPARGTVQALLPDEHLDE